MDFQKVFIVGSGRSGTTWVQKIFLNHPAVVGPATESKVYALLGPFMRNRKDFDTQYQEILEAYDAYPVDTRLKMLIARENFLALIESLRGLKISSKEKAQRLADGIFRSFFVQNGGPEKVFAEKTPHHLFFVREILEMYPSAKIICLIRDGRDVCHSLQRAREKGVDWCPEQRREQILFWKNSAECYLNLLADEKIRRSLLTVRYEDLKENTRQQIFRMFEFAQLPAPEPMIQKIIKEQDVGLLAGRIPSVHTGAVGGWKDVFSPEDHKLFSRLCGDLLVRMGYSAGDPALF